MDIDALFFIFLVDKALNVDFKKGTWRAMIFAMTAVDYTKNSSPIICLFLERFYILFCCSKNLFIPAVLLLYNKSVKILF